jgi:hypothetical protein
MRIPWPRLLIRRSAKGNEGAPMGGVLLDMAISLDGFVGRVDETDPGLYD